MTINLPVIRSGERMDYKRCVKKWYWAWRRGLVPRNKTFGPLDLGTWMHSALAEWYGKGTWRNDTLVVWFTFFANEAIHEAEQNKAPDYIIEKAEELAELGKLMAERYEKHYGNDSDTYVLDAEIPLEFSIPHPDDPSQIMAIHKLKPDLVFADREKQEIWLMEHKTAKQVQLEHLVIDDQARPYGAMAERALRKLGIIQRWKFKGILYNFLRKAMPDERPRNSKGQYLNQDGRVSKKQTPPYFVRKPITLTRAAKRITLGRLQAEAKVITNVTLMLRKEPHLAAALPKTPHKSCPKTCQFFTMCVAEEEGGNIKDMERMMFMRRDPYLYEEESTDERIGFEIS
jgi:hypothetical protein